MDSNFKNGPKIYTTEKVVQRLTYENLSKQDKEYLVRRMDDKIISANSKNLCGEINYNKYGKKNGIGLKEGTDIFCDGFLIYLRIPLDDLKKEVKNATISSANTHIRKYLKSMGIVTNDIGVCRESIPILIPDTCFGIQGTHPYKKLIFKIGVPNLDIASVILMLVDKKGRNQRQIYLEDVDFTIDTAGSFHKEEVIDYLLYNKGYRMEGSLDNVSNCTGTICDNSDTVGNNCLSYVQTLDGFKIRPKIYDKFVQMVESKGVKTKVGNHWKNWITQTGTRLAKARNATTHRGLSRLEATLYLGDNANPKIFIQFQNFVKNMVNLFPANLIFCTPHSAKWKALAEVYQHSLVVHNKTNDTGIVVYNHNENTGKTSGIISTKKFTARRSWILGNLTLASGLPIDLITWEYKHTTPTTTTVDLEYSCIQKVSTDILAPDTTRVTDYRSVYSSCVDFNGDYHGMEAQKTCIPFVSTKVSNTKSKTKWEFYSLLPPGGPLCNQPILLTKRATLDTVTIQEHATTYILKQMQIQTDKQKIDLALQASKIRLHKEILAQLQQRATNFLGLQIGEEYKLVGSTLVVDRFGCYKDKIVLCDGKVYWGNLTTTRYLDRINANRIVGQMYVYDNIKITRTGTATTCNGRNKYAQLQLNTIGILVPKEEKSTCLQTVPSTHRVLYNELVELTILPIHSVLYPVGMYTIRRHNKDQLVLTIGTTHYRAGLELEAQVGSLQTGVGIRLGVTKTNKITRKKYVTATVFTNQEWWKLVPYVKLSVVDSTCGITKSVKNSNGDVIVLTSNLIVGKLRKIGLVYKKWLGISLEVDWAQ